MSPNSADARQKLTKRHCSKHQAKIITYAWQHLPIDTCFRFLDPFVIFPITEATIFTSSVMGVRVFGIRKIQT